MLAILSQSEPEPVHVPINILVCTGTCTMSGYLDTAIISCAIFFCKIICFKTLNEFYFDVIIDEKGQNLGKTAIKICAGKPMSVIQSKPMVLNDQFIWQWMDYGNLAAV
jgi:hypothetical protein